MKIVIKIILILGLFLGALYLFNDQRKKLGASKSKILYNKTKGYSIEELQQRRNNIIRNIDEQK